MIYEICRTLCVIIAKLLFRLEAHDIGNVPTKGGYMLISNHASNLDPVLVGGCIRRHVHFLAKKQLFEIPVFGWLLRKIQAHPINREGMDREAMRESVEVMRRGEILVIFPEGTRTSDGNLQETKAGAAMMAVQAGVACIPAYIAGSFQAWPKHKSLPRPSKVDVYYGKPFYLPDRQEGKSSKEHYRLCAEEMKRQLEALRPIA